MARRAHAAAAPKPPEELKPLPVLLEELERTSHEAHAATLALCEELRSCIDTRGDPANSDTPAVSESAAAHAGEQLDLIPRPRPEPYEAPARDATPLPRTRLNEDVLRVLSACEVDGNAVRITSGQLDRKLYVRVNDALEALGGKWNRKARAHLFAGDPAEALDAAISTGTVVRPQDLGWFPTPDALARDLVARAGVRPLHRALEPSAGEGAIALALRAAGADVSCVEIDPGRCKALRSHGFDVVEGDFLSLHAVPSYDRIAMNPPFGRRVDVAHVRHAYAFLKPGGRLVSVMAAGVTFRQDRLATEFRALVTRANGSIDPLPGQSFRESGTDVRTVVVTMEAP